MKILKKVAESKVKGVMKDAKKKIKARPSVKKQKEEEEKKKKVSEHKNPKHKFLGMWIDKLENFHVILTAEDGMRKLY